MTTNTSAAILRRAIAPEKDNLSRAAARSILRLDFCDQDHQRMAKLSAKAQTGRLTSAEQEELDEYLRAGDLLAILQSKARKSLQRAGRAS